jgi:hypothetical protein
LRGGCIAERLPGSAALLEVGDGCFFGPPGGLRSPWLTCTWELSRPAGPAAAPCPAGCEPPPLGMHSALVGSAPRASIQHHRLYVSPVTLVLPRQCPHMLTHGTLASLRRCMEWAHVSTELAASQLATSQQQTVRRVVVSMQGWCRAAPLSAATAHSVVVHRQTTGGAHNTLDYCLHSPPQRCGKACVGAQGCTGWRW